MLQDGQRVKKSMKIRKIIFTTKVYSFVNVIYKECSRNEITILDDNPSMAVNIGVLTMIQRGRKLLLAASQKAAKGLTPSEIPTMFNQAQSRGIRACNQALIREGGKQGRVAVSDCC